ncbi:hypothetical protein HUG17_0151 [Dermatophagoides farinae]|nr:hypothetical protein HUG17_0151 [Dermatophagoides farinae]
MNNAQKRQQQQREQLNNDDDDDMTMKLQQTLKLNDKKNRLYGSSLFTSEIGSKKSTAIHSSSRSDSTTIDMNRINSSNNNNHYHALVYHISLGTIMALMLCSTLVLAAVITVAYKKIHRIYLNRNNTYDTLNNETSLSPSSSSITIASKS